MVRNKFHDFPVTVRLEFFDSQPSFEYAPIGATTRKSSERLDPEVRWPAYRWVVGRQYEQQIFPVCARRAQSALGKPGPGITRPKKATIGDKNAVEMASLHVFDMTEHGPNGVLHRESNTMERIVIARNSLQRRPCTMIRDRRKRCGRPLPEKLHAERNQTPHRAVRDAR